MAQEKRTLKSTHKQPKIAVYGYFYGAGDRTRTGTLSPAVDFESVGLFGIQWNVVEPSGIFHLTKHTQPVVFAPKKLQFSAKQPQSKRF